MRLFRSNIKTNQTCDKLDYCTLKPFSIQKQINEATYRFEITTIYEVSPDVSCIFLEFYKEPTFLEECNHHRPILKLIFMRNMRWKIFLILEANGLIGVFDPLMGLRHQ